MKIVNENGNVKIIENENEIIIDVDYGNGYVDVVDYDMEKITDEKMLDEMVDYIWFNIIN